MVYLLPFMSYLAGFKSVSARPSARPPAGTGYDDKYRPGSYSFVERQKLEIEITVESCDDTYNKKARQLVGQCETRRHLSHSDFRLYYLLSLVPKTFMHGRASTRMGE